MNFWNFKSNLSIIISWSVGKVDDKANILY